MGKDEHKKSKKTVFLHKLRKIKLLTERISSFQKNSLTMMTKKHRQGQMLHVNAGKRNKQIRVVHVNKRFHVYMNHFFL